MYQTKSEEWITSKLITALTDNCLKLVHLLSVHPMFFISHSTASTPNPDKILHEELLIMHIQSSANTNQEM
jgi:hypothetical protein